MSSKWLALALMGASAVAGYANGTGPVVGPTYQVVACWKGHDGKAVSCPIGCVSYLALAYFGPSKPIDSAPVAAPNVVVNGNTNQLILVRSDAGDRDGCARACAALGANCQVDFYIKFCVPPPANDETTGTPRTTDGVVLGNGDGNGNGHGYGYCNGIGKILGLGDCNGNLGAGNGGGCLSSVIKLCNVTNLQGGQTGGCGPLAGGACGPNLGCSDCIKIFRATFDSMTVCAPNQTPGLLH